jgi:hypothetical protein
MTPRLATATLTATLAIALATASQANAATVQSYSYEVSGGLTGLTSDPIYFTPSSTYSPGSLTTPGAFVLGTFTTNPLPTTASLTYNDTPFTIDLRVAAPNTSTFSPYGVTPNIYTYQISGMLNGTLSGDGTSSMFATITGITGSGSGQATTPPFPISDLVIGTQGIAAPNGPFGSATTTLTAQVSVAGSSLPGLPSPAPEPSTIVILGLGLAGWARFPTGSPEAERKAAIRRRRVRPARVRAVLATPPMIPQGCDPCVEPVSSRRLQLAPRSSPSS